MNRSADGAELPLGEHPVPLRPLDAGQPERQVAVQRAEAGRAAELGDGLRIALLGEIEAREILALLDHPGDGLGIGRRRGWLRGLGPPGRGQQKGAHDARADPHGVPPGRLALSWREASSSRLASSVRPSL